MMFLMQPPVPSVHPGLPVPCSSPMMRCAELAALLAPIPRDLRVSADSFRVIPLLTALCS